MSTTVRVTEETRDRLAALARATGTTIQSVVDEAVAAYESRLFWDQVEDSYARLHTDPRAWAEVEAERAEWEATTRDGLER